MDISSINSGTPLWITCSNSGLESTPAQPPSSSALDSMAVRARKSMEKIPEPTASKDASLKQTSDSETLPEKSAISPSSPPSLKKSSESSKPKHISEVSQQEIRQALLAMSREITSEDFEDNVLISEVSETLEILAKIFHYTDYYSGSLKLSDIDTRILVSLQRTEDGLRIFSLGDGKNKKVTFYFDSFAQITEKLKPPVISSKDIPVRKPAPQSTSSSSSKSAKASSGWARGSAPGQEVSSTRPAMKGGSLTRAVMSSSTASSTSSSTLKKSEESTGIRLVSQGNPADFSLAGVKRIRELPSKEVKKLLLTQAKEITGKEFDERALTKDMSDKLKILEKTHEKKPTPSGYRYMESMPLDIDKSIHVVVVKKFRTRQ